VNPGAGIRSSAHVLDRGRFRAGAHVEEIEPWTVRLGAVVRSGPVPLPAQRRASNFW
jgi:hypothetical protein